MTRLGVRPPLPAALAFLLLAGCSSAEKKDPSIQKIVDVQVLNAGLGAVPTPPAGYQLLKSLTGDTAGGNVNAGLWNDTRIADQVFIAYRAANTADPVGIAELHVASSDPDVQADLFGSTGHDAIYGAANPGCAANPVDLNAATCRSGALAESYSGWCAYYFWDASCSGPGTELFLHFVVQQPMEQEIRCLVVGDEVAVDDGQPLAARRAHVWWGPEDVTGDGSLTEADADWVLEHVRWVTAAGGAPVNLNRGTQSFARYDWYDCGLGQGYDNAWIRPADDPADAQYLGYCLP